MKIRLRITTNEGVGIEGEAEFSDGFDFATKFEDFTNDLTTMFERLNPQDKSGKSVAFDPYDNIIDEENDS